MDLMLVSLAGLGCAATFALIVVFFAVFVRRRPPKVPAPTEREISAAVAAAAAQVGLAEHNPGVYEGTIRGRRVRWSLRQVEYETGSKLQLAMGTPVETGLLSLTHRTMVYGAELPKLDLPECRIGDPAFDVRFFIHADLEHLSLLTTAVRKALLAAAGDGELRVRNGWMWLDQVATPELAAIAAQRIEAMFAAAQAFAELPPEVEHRVRWLSQDPMPRVRVNTLEMLAVRGASDFTSWIARPLLGDSDPSVRARAAEVLGDGELLMALISDDKAPGHLRTRAGRALDKVGTQAERLSAAEFLSRGAPALQDTALELCRSIGEPSESVALELLDGPDAMIARKAVGLLGRIGTSRTLPILQALADDAEPLLLRVEAHAAAEAIRNRLGGTRRSGRTTPAAEPRTHTPGPGTRPQGRTRQQPNEQ